MFYRLAVASVIVGLAGMSVASAESNWPEPEEGVFAGYAGVQQSDLLLRAALLGDDTYRQCQLVTLPAFGTENAVFIRDEPGQPTVVSRTLRPEVWSKLTSPWNAAGKKASARGQDQDRITPERIRGAVETKTARLDRASADLVMSVCQEVLLRTRYTAEPTRGNDGVTYHAGHWIQGTFLSGRMWSPARGTVIHEFVEMEEALAAFVAAPAAQREGAKAALVAKAQPLLKRVRATPPTDASDGRAGTSAERAVELVAILVKGVAAGRHAFELAADLHGVLEESEAKSWWKVTTDIPNLRISVGAPSKGGIVTEASLYADVATGVRLDALQRRFGAYSVVHESKTSSVRFTAIPASITMHVGLLDSKVNPRAVVQHVTVRREQEQD